MALEAQDNPFPYVTLVDTADPSTPAAGTKRLWVDTDDTLKIIDESDVVTSLVGGGIANPLATDSLWDAAGDLVQGTGANTAAKLGAGTAGQVLMSAGAAAANLWASRELDYVEITSPVNVTATVEASADVCVTGSAVAYDGSTPVMIEAYTPNFRPDSSAASRQISAYLFDGTTSLGLVGIYFGEVNAIQSRTTLHCVRRLTPTAATHTYSIRCTVSAGTGVFGAGAGGAGNYVPAFIRITRAL